VGNRRRNRRAWWAIGLLLAGRTVATGQGTPIGYRALDEGGRLHVLGASGSRGVCTVFLGIDCPISNELVPELARLAAFAADGGVEFYGVLSDPYSTPDELTNLRREFGIPFPVLFDADGALAERLRPRVTPEVFLHDHSGALLYRGRVDDRSEKGRIGGDGPTQRDLFEALSALIRNDAEARQQSASGCAFEGWPAPSEMEVSWSRHVSAILETHCVDCHTDGGPAPFPLHRFEDAARRSKMIARVVLERTMPPSLADATRSDVVGAHRLDDRTIAVLQRWSLLGAPRGGHDPRLQRDPIAAEELLGPPDLVLTMEESWSIPADGPDLFRAFALPPVAEQSRRLVAAEFRPSAARSIRFAQLVRDPAGGARILDSETDEAGYPCDEGIGIAEYTCLATWPIGRPLDRLPEGTGRSIPGGDELVLWLHAHPQGKALEERASVALWFDDSEAAAVSVEQIDLHQGDRLVEHGMVRLRMERVVGLDQRLVSLMPRLGHLGKSVRVSSIAPDGSEDKLLWLDRWDAFRPERFSPRSPVILTAGSRLIVEASLGWQERGPALATLPPTPLPTDGVRLGDMAFLFLELGEAPRASSSAADARPSEPE
jgi:hypothetical protein